MIEPLEGRALLSAVTLSNGVLTVTGNATADRIEVQRRADKGQLKIEINGAEKKFTYSSVKKIVINSLGGNDFVDVSGRDGGVAIPMSVNGGDGNDTLHGGNGNDTINGGNGNDRIEARGGNDVVFGGAGNDWIQGGDGRDNIKGDSGADHLFGEAGDDSLLGGDGDDDLNGGSGHDDVRGNGGNDDFSVDGSGEVHDRGGADDGLNHT
jgi:Ca2+-binding RTX toxin-like protein